MKDHWPLAISTGCCREASLPAVLSALAAAGADRVEIGTPPEHFDAGDRLQAWSLASDLSRAPFTFASIHAPFGANRDMASSRAEHREAAIEGALNAARVIAGQPGGIVVAHPSDLPREGGDTRERLRCALESLLLVDAACRDFGLRLAIETTLPHLVGGHPDEIGWLLERLPDGAGVCLDTGHAHLGRYIDAFIDLAGSRLIHVHLHDNRSTHDDHLIPGEGHIDWCAVFDKLRRAQYAGTLVMELSCAQPSVDHFRNALDAARRLCHLHAPQRLTSGVPS